MLTAEIEQRLIDAYYNDPVYRDYVHKKQDFSITKFNKWRRSAQKNGSWEKYLYSLIKLAAGLSWVPDTHIGFKEKNELSEYEMKNAQLLIDNMNIKGYVHSTIMIVFATPRDAELFKLGWIR